MVTTADIERVAELCGVDRESLELSHWRDEVSRSLLLYCRLVYRLRTGRDFVVSEPVGRQSHIRLIIDRLEAVYRGEIRRLVIAIPPRYGKSTLLELFCTWSLAQRPESQYLYVGYSLEAACEPLSRIRHTLRLPEHRILTGVELVSGSDRQNDFSTTAGGRIQGYGYEGAITGQGAGLPYSSDISFGGALLLDDLNKLSEARSKAATDSVVWNWEETISTRLNDARNTPIVSIAQRSSPHDLTARLIESGFESLILPALDGCGNALDPARHTADELRQMQKETPHKYYTQYQQQPSEAEGVLFRREDFLEVVVNDCFMTFITVDTAETTKTANDASVFSFWGAYYVEIGGIKTGQIALHWLACRKLYLEPKDLVNEFESFYRASLMVTPQPSFVAIEKKSTGVALLSFLRDIPGLRTVAIDRTVRDGSKLDRYLSVQEYIARHLVTFPVASPHREMCLSEVTSITSGGLRLHDDITDTMFDAIKLCYIDKVVHESSLNRTNTVDKHRQKISEVMREIHTRTESLCPMGRFG